MRQSNILDPIQPTLPPHVWEHPEAPEPILRAVHAHFITKHVYGILEKGGYSKPHQWLRLYFTGSLCTYQYADTSDADISLFVDSQTLPEWSRAEMIGLMIEGTADVTLPGTPYELQAYVVGRGIHPTDVFKQGLRAGYSIDDHQWVYPPDHRLSHDVEAQENGFYVYALEQADKMERLLRYEPDKAVDFWHQIHKRRMRDQKMGKGDVSESNIIYKFLAHRNLLPAIAQTSGEYIAKTGAWQDHFLNQIQPIAQAYEQLPELDPNAVGAWQELAQDSTQRANELRNRFNVSVTDNPEPYADAQEMFHDLDKGNFAVSRANADHPIWTPDQNVDFRVVHDILGHHTSGGDFSWQGENQACGAHFPLLSSNAQRALMTECLGQTGYAVANHGFGPQKVGFMDDLLSPAQQTFSSMPAGGFCHRHIRHGIYNLVT